MYATIVCNRLTTYNIYNFIDSLIDQNLILINHEENNLYMDILFTY